MHSIDNRARPLFIEPIRLVMSSKHELAGLKQIQGKDLFQQSVLSIDEHHHLHRQLLGLCEHFGANLLRDVEANSLSSLRLMVMLGMGVAFLPALFIEAEMNQSPDIVVRDLQDEYIARTHVAVWRRNSAARHLFQKLSFEIKSIAMDSFDELLEELKSEDNVPESWT